MPTGLTENSPIQLQLTRENFNALIGRHSQPIRWLVAEKCACIKANRKVDANCPVCKGKGVYYETPTQSTNVKTVTAPIDGVIELPNVIWIRDLQGNNYEFTDGECVTYASEVKKGKYYLVKYIEDVAQSGSGLATYISDKLYSIDIPTVIDFDEVQGELLSVTATNNGTELTVTNLFRNCFEIEESLLESDEVQVSYTYINPFQFALINNDFPKQDEKFLTEVSGRGLLIFPQRWEVYHKDVIVALNATQIKKHVFRSTGTVDSLPSFYIYELKSASVIRNDVEVEFIPGTDFVIYKGNQIKWIGNAPTENEQVSITYSYNTVYKVMKDTPAPRTSEDNRFPRKAYIELYADYNSREAF